MYRLEEEIDGLKAAIVTRAKAHAHAQIESSGACATKTCADFFFDRVADAQLAQAELARQVRRGHRDIRCQLYTIVLQNQLPMASLCHCRSSPPSPAMASAVRCYLDPRHLHSWDNAYWLRLHCCSHKTVSRKKILPMQLRLSPCR